MADPNDDNNTFFFEEVEIEDDDNTFEYKEVDDFEDEDSASGSDEEGFEALLKAVQKPETSAEEETEEEDVLVQPQGDIDAKEPSGESKPVVVDDFIRNFFIKLGMKSSLAAFQAEWYEMKSQGELQEEDVGVVPDIYVRNQNLDNQIKNLRQQVQRAQAVAGKASSTWEKFKKERDFHRMHHRRVQQEKDVLVRDMKRLKKHYTTYEPALKEWKAKYEAANKEKMLMRLENDRTTSRVEHLETQLKSGEGKRSPVPEGKTEKKSKKSSNSSHNKTGGKNRTLRNTMMKTGGHPKDSQIPPDDYINPYLELNLQPVPADKFSLRKTFKGHTAAVAGVGLLVKNGKSILATVADDMTWKLWSLPKSDLIMSGDGHTDWVSGVSFHPKGTHLATASGDSSVKVWSFRSASCITTFNDHNQAVWDVEYHHSGDFLATGSMDHTARLFDINSQRCRQTFRGHVDSVNSVAFLPYGNLLCTASGDKTISLWDIRSGMCTQVLEGHSNAVLSTAFSMKGDEIVSCDADGVVACWDVRMVSERLRIHTCPSQERHSANTAQFDPSGKTIAVGTNDGFIKLYNSQDGELLGVLEGHEDSVQSLAFHPEGSMLVSGGSDSTFRLWS